MAAYRSVLCGIDFSNHSRHALRLAVDLASRGGGSLRLVHVIDVLLAQAAAIAYDRSRIKADAETELRAFAEGVHSAGARWVEPAIEVRIGEPHHEIVEAARQHDVDLLVMGTHGLGGFRKLFFGSVTERVLRETKIPVLAVPLDERHRATAEAAAFSGVFAGIDLDETAIAVATAARTVSAAFDAPLTLVHVVRPIQAAGAWATMFDGDMPRRIEEAKVELRRIAEIVDPAAPPRTLVRTGVPAEEIANVALEDPHAVIAMGLGGGTLLHRPGTTAYRVLCVSTVPVIAMPMQPVMQP